MYSLSQAGDHLIILTENSSNIYFYLFSILNYKTKQNSKQNGQLLFRRPYYPRLKYTAITSYSIKVYKTNLTSRSPPVWEIAVHLAVAGAVFDGAFLCCSFPTRCLGWDPGLNWVSFWGFSYLLLHLHTFHVYIVHSCKNHYENFTNWNT